MPLSSSTVDNRDTHLSVLLSPERWGRAIVEIDREASEELYRLVRAASFSFATTLVFKAADAYREDQSVVTVWADVRVNGQDSAQSPNRGRPLSLTRSTSRQCRASIRPADGGRNSFIFPTRDAVTVSTTGLPSEMATTHRLNLTPLQINPPSHSTYATIGCKEEASACTARITARSPRSPAASLL